MGTLTPSALTPTWVPTDLVAPLDCPVGSDMDLICGPRWASLESRLQRVGQVDEPRDSGAPSDEPLALEPRCGCTTSGGPGWIAVLAPLFLLRRRPTRAA